MTDYDKIKQGLIDAGFSEDTANRLAEVLFDWGWEEIRDVLNNIY
jgi:hypothetical protein